MTTKSRKLFKSTGGSCCAVAMCPNYSSKMKRDGKTDVSFYRFPKDPEFQKKWTLKCRRGDFINPSLSYMCSEHFSKDAYVRNLKAELLGYTLKVRKLKFDAMPTLKLPDHDDLINSIINTDNCDNCSSNKPTSTIIIGKHSVPSIDYEKLYNDLLKKHHILQNELSSQKNELLSIKQSGIELIKINESLRHSNKVLQKKLNTTNLLFIQTKKKLMKKIKIHLQNNSQTVEIQAKQYLSTIFSKNQLDLILGRKKRVCWSIEEYLEGFILRCISERAYVYVKDELHYPLPALSSLQRWAKNIDMENINENAMIITQINGDAVPSDSIKKNCKKKKEMVQNVVEYLADWVAKNDCHKFPELGSTMTEQITNKNIHEHDYAMSS